MLNCIEKKAPPNKLLIYWIASLAPIRSFSICSRWIQCNYMLFLYETVDRPWINTIFAVELTYSMYHLSLMTLRSETLDISTLRNGKLFRFSYIFLLWHSLIETVHTLEMNSNMLSIVIELLVNIVNDLLGRCAWCKPHLDVHVYKFVFNEYLCNAISSCHKWVDDSI